jgi:parvulin-like peptidyl-prolyl isomerase
MPIAPDVVVATVAGKPYTKKQMDEYLKVLPPQGRVAIKQNPTAGLTNLFLIIQLSDESRKLKLDQVSPHKESLEQMSRFGLAQAVATEEQNKLTPTPGDQEAYYKSHQSDYESAKVSAILIAFSTNPKPGPDGKTPRTEAEAKEKAEDLVKQLRAGGDFAKLALENSDDKTSAAKGGEYATIRRSSPSPEPIKQIVLGLKVGDVSDPLRQPVGFYIFKTTAKDTQPFAEAAPAIAAKLKQEKFSEWLTAVQKQYRPKIERPDYFKK